MLTPEFLKGKGICVTGGTGFLGRHLLPMLLEAGAGITCLVRPGSRAGKLPAGVKTVPGDCATGQGLAEAMRGNDILVHMAGLLFGLGWQDYLRANAGACAHIANAVRQGNGAAMPRRVIFVSSLAAAGPCATAPGISEKAVPNPVSAYGWSKLMCERILAAALGDSLVIVRPPIIYGSGDMGLLPLFKSVQKGFAPSPGMGRRFPVSAIHAVDAALGIILACQDRASGIYHLSDGAVYDMDTFCQAMGKALGRDRVYVARLPLAAMAASAAASSALGFCLRKICSLLGFAGPRPPHWNLDKFREARQCGWLADSGRASRELGFRPRMDLAAGMAEAVAGYRAGGWL